MTSISVPCPKVVLVSGVGSKTMAQNSSVHSERISFPPASISNPPLSFGPSLSGFQWLKNGTKSAITKVQAQLKDVVAEKSSNSAPMLDLAPSEGKKESVGSKIPDAASISAFMSQVSDLVKLVDSKDIMELQMKQIDCELIIRKKEALQHPPPVAPVVAMPPSYSHAMLPPPPPAASAGAPATSTPAASVPALPPPAKTSTSSHPPLKCPMAGTFYRCPAPGEPPFVKVGDKVQKGQVICIIEAMKLMNEIEADQSGTIAEILVEDGKPVSVDMPLFVIVP